MKKFLLEEHVGVLELPELKTQAQHRFGWTYAIWHRRETGETPLKEHERLALRTLLTEIRAKETSKAEEEQINKTF